MGRKGCGKQQCNANYNQVTKGSGRKESKGHVLMAVHVRLFKERVRLVVDRFLVLERVVGCCLRKFLSYAAFEGECCAFLKHH